MNRFFHLPSLYVYLLAVVLLVTSVFHAAAIVRQALYAVLDINDSYGPQYYYDKANVTLTAEAEEYLNNLQQERQRSADIANMLRSAVLLALSFGFFMFFWRKAASSAEIEMLFSVRNFYFFLVSSIAFLIFFFSLSAGLGTLVNIATGNDYYFYLSLETPRPETTANPEPITLTLQDVKDRIAAQEQEQEKNMGKSRQRQLIDQLTISIVALPIFYWHNKQLTISQTKAA
ncbi:MAG TPA: hypothetical protein VK905_00555 [Bacillota bacterium]|nr:hypothetical protein [Bacillota bacterium]